MLDGPLGERVFAISVCPSDGDVWIATNAGLSRYSLQNDTWRYYTRADGLPSDQIQALAFDSIGNVYAGTQCDGLAIGKSEGDYAKWQLVPGAATMPPSLVGEGLPSNQINDILVADDETIYVATPNGLARSKDFGESWGFLRGIDWEAKVKNQRGKPTPQQPAENLNRELLREDYVTNIGEDTKGLLFLGYRVKGYEIRRPLNDRVPYISAKNAKDQFPYISTVLPLREGGTLLATYGDGLTQAVQTPAYTPTDAEAQVLAERRGWKTFAPPTAIPTLPTPAQAPTEDELTTFLQKVKATNGAMQAGEGYYEGDDWRTWGDWVGRYGSRYGMLCAASAPFNLAVRNDFSYDVQGFMGPGFSKNSLRHWIHWKQTEIPRVLYVPHLGYRREAEWDDNGEAMSMSIEGPDVWAKVTVPAGTRRLSTYYFNKDGHNGNNRIRDYLLELKKGEAKDVGEAEKLPIQARARIRDFWGGVYKKFVVQGPGTFWLKVGKNNSFNTILCGVFLDKLEGPPTPYETRRDIWLGKTRYEMPVLLPAQKSALFGQSAAALPIALAAALDRSYNTPEAPLQWEGRLLAYRALSMAGWGAVKPALAQRERGATPEIQAQLKRWRWQMALWAGADRSEWKDAMQTAWEKVAARNKPLGAAPY